MAPEKLNHAGLATNAKKYQRYGWRKSMVLGNMPLRNSIFADGLCTTASSSNLW
ncbi:hypothetical protein SK128_007035, partial [Halocaridina rubra]